MLGSGDESVEVGRQAAFDQREIADVTEEGGEQLRRDGNEGPSGVNRDRRSFPVLVDAVHTALYIVELDGTAVAKRWLDERNLTGDQRFNDCLQALVGAIPRSKNQGEWNVAEARLLDRLVAAYFPQIELPADLMEEVGQEVLDLGS